MSSTTRAIESNSGLILGPLCVSFALAFIVALLRLYTRALLLKALGADDALMAVAVLLALGSMVCVVVESFHGQGRHIEFVSLSDQTTLNQLGFWQAVIGIAGAALLKVSLALSLLRLSNARWLQRSLWALIVFVVLYGLFAELTFFLYCVPLSGYWDKTIGAKCYSIDLFVDFALMNTAFNIFSDVAIATLPIPIIWRLQMPLRTRVYLILILGLGWIAVAFGVVQSVNQMAFASLTDTTYALGAQFWGLLSFNVAIIAACAPQLKKLLAPLLRLSSPSGYGARTRALTAGLHTAATNKGGAGGKYMRQHNDVNAVPTESTEGFDFELDETTRPPPSRHHHSAASFDDDLEFGSDKTAHQPGVPSRATEFVAV